MVSKIIEWIAGANREVMWGLDVKKDDGWYHVFEQGEPMLFLSVEDVQQKILEMKNNEEYELVKCEA